jgi:hypothetical protein
VVSRAAREDGTRMVNNATGNMCLASIIVLEWIVSPSIRRWMFLLDVIESPIYQFCMFIYYNVRPVFGKKCFALRECNLSYCTAGPIEHEFSKN